MATGTPLCIQLPRRWEGGGERREWEGEKANRTSRKSY